MTAAETVAIAILGRADAFADRELRQIDAVPKEAESKAEQGHGEARADDTPTRIANGAFVHGASPHRSFAEEDSLQKTVYRWRSGDASSMVEL